MKDLLVSSILLCLGSAAFAGPSVTGGLGNPAAKNCLDKGGELVRVSDSVGEDALCAFGKALVPEWALFLNHGKSGKAFEVFLNHPQINLQFGGNPASVYCAAVGGQIQMVTVAASSKDLGICNFEDRSAMEEWTLYTGAADPANAALVEVINNN